MLISVLVMTKLMCLTGMLICLCAPSGVRADPPFFNLQDKQEHIAASFLLCAGLSHFFKKENAVAIAIGVGLAKEYFHDKEVDPGDIAANGLGVILAIPLNL